MSTMEVFNETGRHADLRNHIHDLLETVAPYVAQTTGLPLPTNARPRLLSPTAWREENRQNTRRVLARDITDLDLTSQKSDMTRNGVETKAPAGQVTDAKRERGFDRA
ncbi:hypothetical protein [Streptomyces sp. NPDC006285]|uniref:hypothetical protein n=1 Tax=Streptomyces sp. NPDC006285 TaxID=3364742 RepID=UPI0036CCD4BF